MQFVGQGQDRFQMRLRIGHAYAADAVEAQRQVIGKLAVGLQQGYVDKEAGSQVGGNRNLHGRILVGRCAYPVA